jgi:hypothetical protein
MRALQRLSEGLARRTTRRGLFGRSAGIATGALLGAAAGTAMRPTTTSAGVPTVCIFPGPTPCSCEQCSSGGVCQKPCTFWVGYASGCWVTESITCCDCVCPQGTCGCGADYHNNPQACP